jgi:hypothetical protein
VESLLALPAPGYWDLLGCTSILLSKDSGNDISDIFQIYKSGPPTVLEASFTKRNHCIFEITQSSGTSFRAFEWMTRPSRESSPSFLLNLWICAKKIVCVNCFLCSRYFTFFFTLSMYATTKPFIRLSKVNEALAITNLGLS